MRPRIMFSAVNGGSGKTFITMGVIAALSARGLKIQAFKKGPDFIDAKWHTLASGRSCYNLDLHLFHDEVRSLFLQKSEDFDISIIEGNHGLFDSIDSDGFGSSAYLARHLATPVILILNCTKMSRSVAAIINGFLNFEPETRIVGVILNNVAGKRHEDKMRQSIEQHCNVPVLGVVNKSSGVNLEQRHLGIVTTENNAEAENIVSALKTIAEKSIDLDKIVEAAMAVQSPIENFRSAKKTGDKSVMKKKQSVIIAVARDAALNFYYPDNLEALEDEGAQLVFFSPMKDTNLPKADGVYLGGGYPEIYARELAENQNMKRSIFEFIDNGLPVFAECGGMMYLTEKIIMENNEYNMAGIIPAQSVMHKKPQGKGYVELITSLENKFDNPDTKKTLWEIPPGVFIRAHEFHYSVLQNLPKTMDCIFFMNRGVGISENRDGLLFKNLLATYAHFHCRAASWWAHSFVNVCNKARQAKLEL